MRACQCVPAPWHVQARCTPVHDSRTHDSQTHAAYPCKVLTNYVQSVHYVQSRFMADHQLYAEVKHHMVSAIKVANAQSVNSLMPAALPVRPRPAEPFSVADTLLYTAAAGPAAGPRQSSAGQAPVAGKEADKVSDGNLCGLCKTRSVLHSQPYTHCSWCTALAEYRQCQHSDAYRSLVAYSSHLSGSLCLV